MINPRWRPLNRKYSHILASIQDICKHFKGYVVTHIFGVQQHSYRPGVYSVMLENTQIKAPHKTARRSQLIGLRTWHNKKTLTATVYAHIFWFHSSNMTGLVRLHGACVINVLCWISRKWQMAITSSSSYECNITINSAYNTKFQSCRMTMFSKSYNTTQPLKSPMSCKRCVIGGDLNRKNAISRLVYKIATQSQLQ